MKKLFLFAAVIVFGLTTMQAETSPKANQQFNNNFYSEVVSHINYPDFKKQNIEEGIVLLKLTLDEHSNVKIIDLNASSPELGKHVRKELKHLNITNTNYEPGKIYYLKVRFNLISGF